MPRFTLGQMLMGVALVAILLALGQAEGCGERYAMIESLSFTSDGRQIAVCKLTARDAQVSMKRYMADVGRTIGWVDVANGRHRETIHHDFKAGNQGPGSFFWRRGRTSAIVNPATDQVAMTAFGGGDVTIGVGTDAPVVVPSRDEARQIADSPSGRYLAASGYVELTLIDTQNNAVVSYVPVGLSFDGPIAAFTADETRLVVSDSMGVYVHDIATGKRVSTVISSNPRINAISVLPDDTVIVCADDWVRRYDLAGATVAEIVAGSDEPGRVLATTATRAAFDVNDWLAIFDLVNNRRYLSIDCKRPSALAFSPTGDRLAVGDFEGRVTLFDATTGNVLWRTDVPGGHRWPWTWPAAALAVWALAARAMYKAHVRLTCADADRDASALGDPQHASASQGTERRP